MSSIEEILAELKAHANPANVAGMACYGISARGTLGVPMPVLRGLARRCGRNHRLARQLWESGIHEARILATLIDDPAQVTRAQMNRWTRDLDSWTCAIRRARISSAIRRLRLRRRRNGRGRGRNMCAEPASL